MRDWAVAASQRSVATLSMPICFDWMTSTPLSMYGCRTRHRAVVEEEGVVVVGRAAEQLDVERAGLALVEAEAVNERLGLLDADLEVVEGRVIVDVRRADDQAVVGNDLDALVRRLLQRVRQRRAVDRRDHQDLLLLGDHVLDLVELGRDVVVGVLQVGVVALGLQRP